MPGGKHGGLNPFTECPGGAKCCSQVLPWGGITGGTAELALV